MANIITNGDIKKDSQISKSMLLKQQQEQAKLELKAKEAAKQEAMGAYKKVIGNAVTKIFAENYGEAMDYNTINKALKFSFKDTKDGLSPDFSFDEKQVLFNAEVKEMNPIEFNPNTYGDFISNDDIINGDNLGRYEFDSSEEYEAYEQGDILYSELDNLDGRFIPTITNRDRFGTFNAINKIKGFSPLVKSRNKAIEYAKREWDKVKKNYLK